MAEVNTELGCGIQGRKVIKRQPILAWEVCSAEEFIRVWLPKFESGQMRPEDAPAVSSLNTHEDAE